MASAAGAALNISDPAVIVAALDAFDRNGTIGALEVGVLISVLLLGFSTVQCYYYYSKFPEDPIVTKTLVAVVLCELGQAISVCHTMYVLTVSDFGNPFALQLPPKSLSVAILFSGLIGPLVQAFFANRIRTISHRWLIPIICWLLSFLRFIGSLVAGGEALNMTDLTSYESQWEWLLTTILAIGAAVDIIIAIALTYYLMGQRTSAYKSTVKVIDKLIAYAIETGVLTSLAGITMLACFVAMKSNFVWLAFFMFLGRLFSNSLLASLNARDSLRSMKEAVVEFSTDRTAYASQQRSNNRSNGINIEMTKQVISDDSSLQYKSPV